MSEHFMFPLTDEDGFRIEYENPEFIGFFTRGLVNCREQL